MSAIACIDLSQIMLCLSTAPALKLNTGISELVLRECRITAEGMALLAQAISVLATLKVLDLSGNVLGAKGSRHLGE